jgi:hypothetical protein
MGLFDWLFGKKRATAPRRPRPRAVSGLEEGSPFVVVNTGKVDIVMPRAAFDAQYGEYSPVASSKPEDEAAVPALVQVVRTSNNKEERKAAIEDLARMGPEGKGASFLLGLLTDTDGQIPWRVFDALTGWNNWTPQVI